MNGEATEGQVTEREATEIEATQSEATEVQAAPEATGAAQPSSDTRAVPKGPHLVITAILDGGARAAAVTRSHGDAWERAQAAASGKAVSGMSVVELSVPPQSFSALRKHFQHPEESVAIYDLFPLSSHLSEPERRVAGQFLAAEVLWTLDEQGLLPGVPLGVKLDVPQGWDRDPKAVHERLMQAGALDIGENGIETYKEVKSSWETAA